LDNYVKKLIQTKGVSSSQCVVNFFHNNKEMESPLRSNHHDSSPNKSISNGDLDHDAVSDETEDIVKSRNYKIKATRWSTIKMLQNV